MVGIGKDGIAAAVPHGLGNLRFGAGYHDGSDIGFHGAPPDMDDHRLAGDVGQRLARQAHRCHAGRYDGDRRGVRHEVVIHEKGVQNIRLAHLYGLRPMAGSR